MLNENQNFQIITNTKILISVLINSIIGFYSYKTKKLTKNASIAAFIIGVISISADYGLFFILVSFFLSSSFLTKLGNSKKEEILALHKKEKVRSVKQVLCNGLIPSLMALMVLVYRNLLGEFKTNYKISDDNFLENNITCVFESDLNTKIFYLIFISYIACCNGDTWASEVGVLSKNKPILITSMKPVPKGTNGGISMLGSLMACLGGIFIGIVYAITQYLYCSSFKFEKILFMSILIGLFSGFIGSTVDSYLGACLQLTIYDRKEKKIVSVKEYKKCDGNKENFILYGKDILSNDSVNFISASFTSILTTLLYLEISG